jgi:hypothetical protein
MLRRSMMLALGTLALTAAPAGAATFTNATPITIPISDETFVNASPYPSDIAVSGVSGPVTDVNVRLNGFSHTFPDDVGIVLVGPGGALMLMIGATDLGTPQPASNLNITFDDSAAAFAPNDSALASTSYKPTNNHFIPGSDNFPAPGPGTAYSDPGPNTGGTATLASTFGGTSANGTWSLFVRDFLGTSQGGLIAGGWSLDFPNPTAAPPTKAAKKCKKAKKKGKKGGAAAKGCKKKKRKKRR